MFPFGPRLEESSRVLLKPAQWLQSGASDRSPDIEGGGASSKAPGLQRLLAMLEGESFKDTCPAQCGDQSACRGEQNLKG